MNLALVGDLDCGHSWRCVGDMFYCTKVRVEAALEASAVKAP